MPCSPALTPHAGLRHIKPYPYVYNAPAKKRWLGRLLLDVVAEEFGSCPREFYARQVRAGRLRVNGACVGEDYVVRSGDRLSHAVTREETPVRAEPLRFVYRDRNLLVVDKPCGVPVHPCGSFYFNSLQGILATDHGLRRVHSAHRLDMPTSGVLLMGCSMTAAQHACALIRGHHVKKLYLARVRGRFPRGPGQSEGLPRWQPRDPVDAHATAARIRAGSRVAGAAPPEEHSPAAMDMEVWWGPAAGEDSGAMNEAALLAAAQRTQGFARFEGVSLDDDEGEGEGEECGGGGEGEGGAAVSAAPAPVAAPTAAEAPSGASAGEAWPDRSSPPPLPSPASVAGQLGARVLLSCPIGCIDAARGVYACAPEGKDALTVVQALCHDARRGETLVACEPRTGRTHQLRVHLLQAGFPIVDDPVYGPPDVRDRYLRAKVIHDAEGRRHLEVEGEPAPDSPQAEAAIQRRLNDQRRYWAGISLHAWAYGTREEGEGAPDTAVDRAAAPILAALNSLVTAAIPKAGKQVSKARTLAAGRRRVCVCECLCVYALDPHAVAAPVLAAVAASTAAFPRRGEAPAVGGERYQRRAGRAPAGGGHAAQEGGSGGARGEAAGAGERHSGRALAVCHSVARLGQGRAVRLARRRVTVCSAAFRLLGSSAQPASPRLAARAGAGHDDTVRHGSCSSTGCAKQRPAWWKVARRLAEGNRGGGGQADEEERQSPIPAVRGQPSVAPRECKWLHPRSPVLGPATRLQHRYRRLRPRVAHVGRR